MFAFHCDARLTIHTFHCGNVRHVRLGKERSRAYKKSHFADQKVQAVWKRSFREMVS